MNSESLGHFFRQAKAQTAHVGGPQQIEEFQINDSGSCQNGVCEISSWKPSKPGIAVELKSDVLKTG